jgi:hypothetical protein
VLMVEGESITLFALVSQASTAQVNSTAPERHTNELTHIRCASNNALAERRRCKPGSDDKVIWRDVRVAESDVDSTPFHPEPGRARRQRRRVLRGGPRGRRGRCAHIPPVNTYPIQVMAWIRSHRHRVMLSHTQTTAGWSSGSSSGS